MRAANHIEARPGKTSLQRYLSDVAFSKPLPQAEEASLAKRIHAGDRDARDRLVEANPRFVVRIAKDYQNRGLSLDDLISAGNVGLIVAAERFDETKGTKFITYAVWWIRQVILQTLTDHSRTVRLPSNRIELLQRVTRTMSNLQQEGSDIPPVEDIAKELDLLESNQPILSLDSLLFEDEDHCVRDLVVDQNHKSPDEDVLEAWMKDDVWSVLGTLDDREQEVIRLYCGLDDGSEEMTLEAIGDTFELTPERVRQIKEKALRKLRSPAKGQKLVAYAEEL